MLTLCDVPSSVNITPAVMQRFIVLFQPVKWCFAVQLFKSYAYTEVFWVNESENCLLNC